MQWIILALVSLTAAMVACVVVACAARILAAVPSAGVRRWIVILSLVVLSLPVAWLAIVMAFFAEDFGDVFDILRDDYRALPWFTLLLTVPPATAAAALAWAGASGFWPAPGVPYEPRAASWSLGRMMKWLSACGALLLVAAVAQDFMLRSSLRRLERESAATAVAMAPAAADEDANAAVHYQRAAGMMKEISVWRDEEPYKGMQKRLVRCDVAGDEVEEYFRRLEPLYAELRLAAGCEACRFDDEYVPMHLIDGMETRYALISAMQLVRQLADYRACQGQADEAVGSLLDMQRFVQHLGADPRAREGVFYYWLESWIRQGVEHLSAHGGMLPEAELQQLITSEPLATQKIFREGLRWRAAATGQHLADVYDGTEFERDDANLDVVLANGGKDALPRWLLLAAMRFTTQRDEEAALAATYPFTVRPNDENAWGRDLEDVTPTGNLVESAVASSDSMHWLAKAEANRRLVNLGVAATLYRQDEGRWPAKLEALVPKYLAEVQPAGEGEEPFRVKAIDGGLMVYSAEMDELAGKFKDARAWWEEAGESYHYAQCMFLGTARERMIEFERAW